LTPELIIIFVLIGLLVFQQAFHSWQIGKMTNKLMSRSYVEYIQAENQKRPTKKSENDNNISEDPYLKQQVEQQAQEMNSMLGMI
jgi:hypothetical protein